MKLFLQITLGVFVGTLGAHIVINRLLTHQENSTKLEFEKQRLEQGKIRVKQGEQIRELLLQSRQSNHLGTTKRPDGFVPDDAQ